MRFTVREIIATVLLAVVIFFAAEITIQSCEVVGSSMEPNLHTGQHLLISKAAYFFDEPERGDVVVFDPPIASDRDFIKRIIALPEETVEIKEGKVYITDTNGDTFMLDEPYTPSGQEPNYTMPPQQVPDGCYFVLGDNRNHSTDSHVWVQQGLWLTRQDIMGKAWLSYWPLSEWHWAPNHSFALITWTNTGT